MEIKPLTATTQNEITRRAALAKKKRPAKAGDGRGGTRGAARGGKRPPPSAAGSRQRGRAASMRAAAAQSRTTDPTAAARLDEQAARLDALADRLDELAAAAASAPAQAEPAEQSPAQAFERLAQLAELDPLAAIEEAGIAEDLEGDERSLPWMKGADETSFAFRQGVLAVAQATGFPADEIWGVIGLESAFDPAKRNPAGGATGLIQWMPRWAPVPVERLARMTREDQLPYVLQFFQRHRWRVPGDAYVATFWPAALGKGDGEVIARKGEIDPTLKADVYAVNRGLDTDGDGVITVGDVRAKLLRAIGGARRIPTDGADPEPSPNRARARAVAAGWVLGGGAVVGLFALAVRRWRR